MKTIKHHFLFISFIFLAGAAFAQKQSFDVVSFVVPKGWEQQQGEAGVQLSVSDKKTGAYAVAVITKATGSGATANENFTTDWARLIKSTVQINEEPTMLAPQQENGWNIISGSASYSDAANKGMATLMTATGGGRMVSVVLMTNTQQYQNELLSLINSLELTKAEKNEINSPTTRSDQPGKSSVVGLWTDYLLETTGYTINGMPQYTAGYLRKEYAFYPDGTYLFRNKQWLTKTKDILFIFESGTYEVHGNQITLTPKNSKSGFWEKKKTTVEWGKSLKTYDYKLEKITYTFTIKYFSGSDDYRLDLNSSKSTQRDGGQFNSPTEAYEFHYTFRKKESLVDNPPGVKTGFENKSLTATGSNTTTKQSVASGETSPKENPNSSNYSASSNVSQLPGIWGQYRSEPNTAGYDWREYYFNTDGSYQFLQKNISYLYQNEIVFAYEKGTYKLNGDQLTISPQSGTVESWSKAGSDKAGKLLKTEKRTLEKVAYTMSFHYFSGIQKTNLVLQYSKHTFRDGAFSNNASFQNSWLYDSPYTPNKPSIELPAGTKIPFSYKSVTTGAVADTKEVASGATINSPISGKIWEAQTMEKYGAAYGNSSGFYTGGFWKYQYKFNTDGTYCFVYNAASGIATNPVNVLQYETGTYTVNGSQLTITPLKGVNEEWSVGKINNGMSAEHIREVLKTRIKRLKTTTRKLEKITYSFAVEYWQGNNANALCLKHTQNTVREGSPGQNDQSCFFEIAAAKAENFTGLFK